MTAEPPPATPGPVVAGPPVGMLDLGALVGATVWWCEQLFTVTGRWVPSTPEAAVRAHLAELSRLLGEHGPSLRLHLPRPAPVDPAEWVRPHAPHAEAVLAALDDVDASVARLAGLHRSALPRLVVAASRLVGDPDPSRRALARALGHLRADLASLGGEGEALLQALVVDLAAAERVGAQVSAVERAWSRSGPVGVGAPEPPSGLLGA